MSRALIPPGRIRAAAPEGGYVKEPPAVINTTGGGEPAFTGRRQTILINNKFEDLSSPKGGFFNQETRRREGEFGGWFRP